MRIASLAFSAKPKSSRPSTIPTSPRSTASRRHRGVTALVMELVEGEDLSQRIARGAIPLDEALPIAKQIADALEAAHEQGIIHRDLKPANIKVRADGTVKVLDFGLAKAMEPAAGSSPSMSMSPTITTPAMMTGVGMILGTAAYMSPEQAKGRVADKRSDVWAFGCVLYEMLTGQRAFAGDDVGEVLAEVIKVNVDWRRLEAVRNAALVTLVRRCLRKEPRQRPGDGGAIRLEIDEAIASPVMMLSEARRRSNIPLTWAIAGAIVAMVAAAAATLFLRAPVPARPAMPTAHVVLPLPSGTTLRDGPAAVISPDGSQIAYVASRGGVSQLYIRSLGDFEPRPLTGTQNAAGPFFSPDSKWVGFLARRPAEESFGERGGGCRSRAGKAAWHQPRRMGRRRHDHLPRGGWPGDDSGLGGIGANAADRRAGEHGRSRRVSRHPACQGQGARVIETRAE